jgi:hypothetical protein
MTKREKNKRTNNDLQNTIQTQKRTKTDGEPKFLTGTIFLHAHLQAVYYNCVKFHLNPMSRLGGVVLTSPSLHTERISEYKLNYPPFQILDSNHIPSCTSADSVLQLCKVS